MAIRFFVKPIIILTSLCLVFTVFFAPTPVSALNVAEAGATVFEFEAFVNSVKNGKAETLRGFYAKNLVALPIIQQPIGDDNFVSPVPGYATEFRLATENGNVGILAHNYLAGQSFFALSPGKEIKLIYGDGKTEIFVVTHIKEYQALSPDSPTSDFLDLNTGERFTASNLFSEIYGNQSGEVILQTCISANQGLSWGRLFVIARPINQVYAN